MSHPRDISARLQQNRSFLDAESASLSRFSDVKERSIKPKLRPWILTSTPFILQRISLGKMYGRNHFCVTRA
jgi:hypothetical protein